MMLPVKGLSEEVKGSEPPPGAAKAELAEGSPPACFAACSCLSWSSFLHISSRSFSCFFSLCICACVCTHVSRLM